MQHENLSNFNNENYFNLKQIMTAFIVTHEHRNFQNAQAREPESFTINVT